MNRIKVWLYSVLVVAVAFVAIRELTLSLRADAIAAADARLAAAAEHVAASARALAHEASAVAALAARDPQLLDVLHPRQPPPPPPAPTGRRANALPPPLAVEPAAQEGAVAEAARAALAAAEVALGFELPSGTVVTAGNRAWLARQRGDVDGDGDGDGMGHLRAAMGGEARRGWIRRDAGVFYAAGAPAGTGAGVLVLVPLDEAWATSAAARSAVDATLSAPGVKPASSLPADRAQAFSEWPLGPDAVFDVGALRAVTLTLGALKIPDLPYPWDRTPAHRARAVPLQGVENGFVVVSTATGPALDALAQLHWRLVVALAAILLVGLLLGVFVRSSEAPAAVPEELLAAAARIERGDFAARAPGLAGKFGTIAGALNRAAELAGPAAAAATAAPPPAGELFAAPLPEPFSAPTLAIPPPPEAASPPWASEPVRSAAPARIPDPPPAAPIATAAAPELLQAAVRAAGPAAHGDDDPEWQQVFEDFLRTRASCGEPTEGLTYEKFRVKLRGNRAALVAKYACRTVRFQVYVKEGKAALKATPVK
jgi:hypothetical protein